MIDNPGTYLSGKNISEFKKFILFLYDYVVQTRDTCKNDKILSYYSNTAVPNRGRTPYGWGRE